MDETSGPSLADDEATLRSYAANLVSAVDAVAPHWLLGLIAGHAPDVAAKPDVQQSVSDGAAKLSADLQTLLERDIADQSVGPLEILRRAVSIATAALAAAGVPAVARDEFAVRNFPDDVYDLTPASFGAVDPSLHEPGLMWGAAKAHVHLRRRKVRIRSAHAVGAEPVRGPDGSVDQSSSVEGVSAGDGVVVLSVDLMDRSKISAAYPDATLVRSPAKLVQAAASASLVLVDLNRLDDLATLSTIEARVVAFGSHVDDAQLVAAEDAGAEALPRSVFFRRLENGEI